MLTASVRYDQKHHGSAVQNILLYIVRKINWCNHPIKKKLEENGTEEMINVLKRRIIRINSDHDQTFKSQVRFLDLRLDQLWLYLFII